MKRLDPRTMVIMLAIFALGYATCLAMPTAQADTNSPVITNRSLPIDYIEFSNGARIYTCGDKLCLGRPTQDALIVDGSMIYGGRNNKLGINSFTFINHSLQCIGNITGHMLYSHSHLPIENDTFDLGSLGYKWANIYCDTLHAKSADGELVVNLNADQLDGYSAEDFVLKSELP